jgi:hypothetical protein
MKVFIFPKATVIGCFSGSYFFPNNCLSCWNELRLHNVEQMIGRRSHCAVLVKPLRPCVDYITLYHFLTYSIGIPIMATSGQVSPVAPLPPQPVAGVCGRMVVVHG